MPCNKRHRTGYGASPKRSGKRLTYKDFMRESERLKKKAVMGSRHMGSGKHCCQHRRREREMKAACSQCIKGGRP